MTTNARNKQSLAIAIDRSNKLKNLINNGTYNYHKWNACQKKRKYDTEYEAINAFYTILNNYPKQKGKLVRYQCAYCDGWHIGHKQT